MTIKDELFNKFIEFKALVENQPGQKIKVLRSNNGEEYTSKDFDAFCKEARIKRELTIPYNPQKWGCKEEELIYH
jgi:transposase InsO family protein